MRRIFVFTLVLLLAALSVLAKPVDKKTAARIAKNFYAERMPYGSFPGIADISLKYYQGSGSYYIVNIKKNRGFILVAADDVSIPVWAYAFHGRIDAQANYPQNVSKTIEDFSKQLEYLVKNNISATHQITTLWKKYSKGSKTKGGNQQIGPLLTSVWAQGCYYNDSTPSDPGGPCGHVVTGCVATAMAQVLNYYQYPAHGSGSHSYSSNYGVLSANFASTTYNWNAMPDTLNSGSSPASVSAVATLISHCGIAVDMGYSAGASGAYSQNAANAFVHYFNYDEGLQLLRKNNYADSVWEQMVKTELDSLRPLYYDGSGSGGHAFVCDGYQGNHYFHFNWGWSGAYNGYFLLSALNPGGMNFSNYCGAVFGMKPGVPKSCSAVTDTLIHKSGNLSDGSYALNYQNNQNCSWLISPPGAVSIVLEFYTFDLQAGDTVYVYDGSSANAPLLAALSGDSLPNTIASSAGQMFVNFVSDAQNTSAGWSAHYYSRYCNGLTVISNSLLGTISDGSGADTYNNNTNCYWLITDSMNRSISLEFTSFQTESGFDYVDIYDGTNTMANQLGSFSGNTLPSAVSSTGGAMLIHFHSDGGVVDDGWEAQYSICAKPQAPYSSTTAEICQDDSLILSIPTAVDSFIWLKDGNMLSNTSSQLVVEQSGIYAYQAYIGLCSPMVSDSVVVNVNPLPQPDLGNDTLVCKSQGLLLDGGAGFTSYLWSTGDTTRLLNVDTAAGSNQLISLKVWDAKSCSNSDTIRVRFLNCAAIHDNVHSDLVSIYPNPANDYLNIMFEEKQAMVGVSIYSMQGRRLFYKDFFGQNTVRLDVSLLAKGSYVLLIKRDADAVQKVFLKE